jgi:hypothetical protein
MLITKKFMLKNMPSPPHAPNLGGPPVPNLLRPHTYFLWDRLGCSGRKINPDKQHYNAEVKAKLNEKKIVELKLPVKGHKANPTELFQATIQDKVKRWRRRGRGQVSVGPQNLKDVQMAVSEALEEMKYRPEAFSGYYTARATGKHMRKRWTKEKVARKVAKKRQEEGGILLDWPQTL